MKKTILAAIAAFSLLSTAALAADLPSKKYYTAPVAEAPVPVALPFYLGVNGGYSFANTSRFSNGYGSVGAVLGFQFNPNFAVEGAYDHMFDSGRYSATVVTPSYIAGNATATTVYGKVANSTNILALNGILGYPMGSGLTPYLLAGAGYRWSPLKDEAIYNIGGGVKYALSHNVDLDLRYRFVNDFNNRQRDNLLSAGFAVKF